MGRLTQHERSGTHQSNGNPRTQSSKPMKPTCMDGYTIREVAVEYLREMTLGSGLEADVEPLQSDAPSDRTLDPAVIPFGWARRVQLKHPGFSTKMGEFLRWIFYRGNEKGNSKCSAGAMRHLATVYGKPSDLYDSDPFWQAAVQQSGGNRIFADAEIPEEWQVKQYICQMSTTVKQRMKATANVQVLSPDDTRDHLKGHLLEITPQLPGDIDLLVSDILSLAIDLSIIKQMDILKKAGKKGIYNQGHRRSIVVACKLVGRKVPQSLSHSAKSSTSDEAPNACDEINVVVEEDTGTVDDSCFELEELQDLFDSEHNNDDDEE